VRLTRRSHPSPSRGLSAGQITSLQRDNGSPVGRARCRSARWLLHNSEAVGQCHTNTRTRSAKWDGSPRIGRIRPFASHRPRPEGVYAIATASSSTRNREHGM
jgi:hypothetical protein